jgi:hypothetical protein
MSRYGRAHVVAIDHVLVFIATDRRIGRFLVAALPADWAELLHDERIDAEGSDPHGRLADAPSLHWTSDITGRPASIFVASHPPAGPAGAGPSSIAAFPRASETHS